MSVRIVGNELFFKDAEGNDCYGRIVPPGRLEIEVPNTEFDADFDGPPPQVRQDPALVIDRETARELSAVLTRFAETGGVK